MKLIFKILLPVFIFIISLWILLLAWGQFRPSDDKNSTRNSWSVITPGNSNNHPLMLEIFELPELVTRHRITNKFGIVADTVYRLNRFGIRDDVNIDQPKKSHLLFGGCSYIFGDNIQLEETFPAILRNKFPDINVRNLGFPGGGLHTALRHFEISDFREFVPEKKGIYAYVYIDDHYSRWARDVGFLRWAGEKTPTYDSVNGKIVYAGQLGDRSEYKRYHFLKFLGIALPETGQFIVKSRPETEKMKSFMDGIVLLKERYLARFPEGRFVWILHPHAHFTPPVEKLLRSVAEKRGIEVMFGHKDYQAYLRANKLSHDQHLIRWDGHPNGEFNKWFAEWLRKKLL